MKFLPTTPQEVSDAGWDTLDVILVSGDTYIDHPSVGVAMVGRILLDAGFKVGIIAQPDVGSGEDIRRLGEPRLFWGVSSGCVDSMVANYTAIGKRRKSDDFTPGGINNRRPDRAVIVYANLIRRYFKKTAPIVLGGIEASLRRVAHYDFWSNSIRRSILFDAKADYLLYGMADRSVVALARALENGQDPIVIPGLCYIGVTVPDKAIVLPGYETVAKDAQAFTEMFAAFYKNNDFHTAKPLVQQHGNRFLIHNPPSNPLSVSELDHLYGLPFSRDLHPYYARDGKVSSLDTIRFSITTHRGCYGECNFCAIAIHQGRTVLSRSNDSIVAEAENLARHPSFKGIIHDVGGATANMYGIECDKKKKTGACRNRRCLFPTICPKLVLDHRPQIVLLRRLLNVKGVKKVFVASGIRHDMVVADKKHGRQYLQAVVENHTSGQMKVAPEHCRDSVLALMGKPGTDSLLQFRNLFSNLTRQSGKKQFLTYYFIAAYPGCKPAEMEAARHFCNQQLKITPQQTQIFTPTPSTYGTLMYWTERNPFDGTMLYVEKNSKGKQRQKDMLTVRRKKKKL